MKYSSALIALAFLPAIAQAQRWHGVTRDSVTGLPVAGVVISVFDVNSRGVARAVSNERGEYRLDLTSPARRLRLTRIGFRPRELSLTTGDIVDRERDIRLVMIPTLLEPVQVADNPKCSSRPDRGQALSLWQQVQAALLASSVARDSNPPSVRRVSFRRMLDRNGEHVLRMLAVRDSEVTSRPFLASFDADTFVKAGFVRLAPDSGMYYGPDAEVFLSDDFARGYCFRIAPRDAGRPKEVGLGFEPADFRGGRVDIAGTVWVDTASRKLVNIDYQYRGLDRRVAYLHPGGSVTFHTMPNGIAMIDRWFIRMTQQPTGADVLSAFGSSLARHNLWVDEVGAELVDAQWPTGETWWNPLGRASITLTQHGVPAKELLVRLADTDYQGRTDSTGKIFLDELLPGPYTIAVSYPELADLRIYVGTEAKFEAARDSTLHLNFEVPDGLDYAAKLCGTTRGRTSPVIVGRVITRDGKAAVGAAVSVAFANVDHPQILAAAKTDDTGLFHICSAPRDRVLEIRADLDGEHEPVVVLRTLAKPIEGVALRFR